MEYISSDFHLAHKNIFKFCNRPFKTIDEFDIALIKEVSQKIKENDTLYFLGDLAFSNQVAEEFINSLKGKMVFIKGNHDYKTLNFLRQNKNFREKVKVYDYLEIVRNQKTIVLFHYPILEWNKAYHGSIHLYGHWHGKHNYAGKCLDVGWDVHKKILTLDEAISMADAKPINPFYTLNTVVL